MNTIQHCFWPFPNWFLLFCGMFGAFCNPQIGFALPLHVITPTNSYVYLSMSDTFLFFFQDTKAIFSKHVCKDYINSVPIFFIIIPFFLFICRCLFMSVRMLPNYSFNLFFFSFQMILSISSHCCVGVFFVGPKLFNFWFLTDKIKKTTRIKCYMFKSKYGSLQSTFKN